MPQRTDSVGSLGESSAAVTVAEVLGFFAVVALCLRATLLDIPPSNRKDAVPPRRAKQQRQQRRLMLAIFLVLAAASAAFMLGGMGSFVLTAFLQFAHGVPPAPAADDSVLAVIIAKFQLFLANTDLIAIVFQEQLGATEGERFWFVSLCMLASTIVLFVFVESHRCCLRGGANMLLGFVMVGLCVSTPLFLCGVATTSNETYWTRFIVPGRHVVGVAVAVSIACVTMFVFTDAAHAGIILAVQIAAAVGGTFVGQLYFHLHPTVVAQTAALRSRLMLDDHAVVDAPFTAGRQRGASRSSSQFIADVERLVVDQSWISQMYAALAGAAGVIFAVVALGAARSEHFALWPTLRSVFGAWHAGPAARCAVYDTFAAMAAIAVVAANDENTPRGWLALAAVASIVSPSIGVPLYLFARERALQNRYFLALSWALVDQDNHRGHGHGGEWSEPPLTRLANDDDVIAAATEPPRSTAPRRLF